MDDTRRQTAEAEIRKGAGTVHYRQAPDGTVTMTVRPEIWGPATIQAAQEGLQRQGRGELIDVFTEADFPEPPSIHCDMEQAWARVLAARDDLAAAHNYDDGGTGLRFERINAAQAAAAKAEVAYQVFAQADPERDYLIRHNW